MSETGVTAEARRLAWRAWQIPQQLEAALAAAVDPETGEVADEEAMRRVEALAEQRVVTLTDLGLFVKQLETVALTHLDSVIAELQQKRERVMRARDIARAVIERLLPVGERHESDFVTLSWRRSEAVVVESAPELLPERFQRVRVEADKTAIKAALRAGETVTGARLEVRHNLQVR